MFCKYLAKDLLIPYVPTNEITIHELSDQHCKKVLSILENGNKFISNKTKFAARRVLIYDNHEVALRRIGSLMLHQCYRHERDARVLYDLHFDLANRVLKPTGWKIITNINYEKVNCDYMIVRRKGTNLENETCYHVGALIEMKKDQVFESIKRILGRKLVKGKKERIIKNENEIGDFDGAMLISRMLRYSIDTKLQVYVLSGNITSYGLARWIL